MQLLPKLNIIDRLVLKSFVGPYLLSFFVAQFVLVMQFLWKYIDEILGKGFGVLDMLELIFYFGVTQISMALPIAILLSSVMVFGNMSERYELSSMKSAGISLVRIMRPAIMLAIATALLSLIASNYLKPQANFQYKKRFRIMKAQKSSLSLEEKVFNRDFSGYAIHINEKLEDEVSIRDIYVYDHTENDKSLVNLTKANYGKMYNSEDGRFFIMELNDGVSYKEMKRETRGKGKKGKKYPFMRTQFEEWKKVFNMGEFDTDDNGINMNRNAEDMLNTFQLLDAIDSMGREKLQLLNSVVNDEEIQKKKQENVTARKQQDMAEARNNMQSQKNRNQKGLEGIIKNNSTLLASSERKPAQKEVIQLQLDTLSAYDSWYQTISKDDKNGLTMRALAFSSRRKDLLRNASSKTTGVENKENRYLLRLHQQWSFAIICIVFLFIGAPLGSIIRKGGYGYPLLIAILFYMLFIITTIMGEKLAIRSQTLNPLLAAWMANLIVGPVAIWLTIKALRDRKFNNVPLVNFLSRLVSKK